MMVTWREADDRDENAIETVLPERRQNHAVQELFLAYRGKDRKKNHSKDYLEVLTIADRLSHLKSHAQQNSQAEIDNYAEENWNNLVPLKKFDWEDIEESRVVSLEVFLSVFLGEVGLRPFLVAPRFVEDHFFGFVNHGAIESSIVVLDIPFGFHLHLLLAQMDSQTDLQ